MNLRLKRFATPISRATLPDALKDPARFQVEDLELDIDFGPFDQVFKNLREQGPVPASDGRARWDQELAEPLHKCLRGLSRTQATDMNMWHWLCVVPLSEVVWLRWTGTIPRGHVPLVTTSIAGRFLGSSTLNGVSRNTLARLWWCAETLFSHEEDYRLVGQAFEKQDLFQAIFDRQFGLYPPAARACVRVLKDTNEEHWRSATRRLNHVLTTTVLEALDEEQIAGLLDG